MKAPTFIREWLVRRKNTIAIPEPPTKISFYDAQYNQSYWQRIISSVPLQSGFMCVLENGVQVYIEDSTWQPL